MLKTEVNGRLATAAIVLAAIAFPIFWYQEFGSAPVNNTAIVVIVLYVISILGFAAFALGKLGPELTSAETDRKIQRTVSGLASKYLPLIFGILVLWSCYSIWRVLNAT